MIEDIFRSARSSRRVRSCLLASAFEDLVAYLVKRGYPAQTIRRYVTSRLAPSRQDGARRDVTLVGYVRISAAVGLGDPAQKVPWKTATGLRVDSH
jgi:hypothetical protein